MPPDPDAVLRRLTDRLAPLERDLHQALWAAAASGGDEVADVVGPLEAADDHHFAVRNRRGELVRIPRERALAAKVVPPR